MSKSKSVGVLGAVLISLLATGVLPRKATGSSPGRPALRFRDVDPIVETKIEAAWSYGLEMVKQAARALSKDPESLSAAEWALLERFFDPAGSGELDAALLNDLHENYQAIDQEFGQELTVEYETDSPECWGVRLYYTDFIRVHVCPYFLVEEDLDRIARDFVHELAHIAFMAQDRAYYSSSSQYARMSPHGHWTSHLPVVGRLFRELTLRDTLYNPDSYSEFAYALSVLDELEANRDAGRAVGEEQIQRTSDALAEARAADQKYFGASITQGP